MTPQRQALLGLFFVMVFAILGWFTLFKSDVSLFREPVSMTVHFEEAGGLRKGDPVLVAGLRWGEVESLTYDAGQPPPRRVEVVLNLDQEIRLFEDHLIQIEDATVLGGKQLTIDPGEPVAGEVAPDELHGRVSPGVLKALGEVVSENRDSFSNILTGLEALVGDVRTGEGVLTRLLYDEALGDNLAKAVDSIAATFENAQELTADLREGKGNLGKLMSDPELYDKVEGIAAGIDDFVATAQGLLDDVRAGKGTLGMLLNDEEASADLKATIANLDSITADLAEGRGTLGKLLKDPTIGENLEKITGDLAEGRGPLGKLLTEAEVYEDVAAIADDLADATAALRDGRGTLSKLVYEDDLYQELRRALEVLTGSLEEAREAAPIATFLNTVFLGF